MNAAATLLRIVLAITLVGTGCSKLLATSADMRSIAVTDLVERIAIHLPILRFSSRLRLARRLFVAIGAIEIATGLWLFSGISRRSAETTATAVFACGLVYIVWARIAAPEKACGCAGATGHIRTREVLRPACFLAATLSFMTSSEPLLIAGVALAGMGALELAQDRWGTIVHTRAIYLLYGRRSHKRLFASEEWASLIAAVPELAACSSRDEWREDQNLVIALTPPSETRGVTSEYDQQTHIEVVAAIRVQRTPGAPIRIVELAEVEGQTTVKRAWTSAQHKATQVHRDSELKRPAIADSNS
jgi:hypothetical protein